MGTATGASSQSRTTLQPLPLTLVTELHAPTRVRMQSTSRNTSLQEDSASPSDGCAIKRVTRTVSDQARSERDPFLPSVQIKSANMHWMFLFFSSEEALVHLAANILKTRPRKKKKISFQKRVQLHFATWYLNKVTVLSLTARSRRLSPAQGCGR